MLTLTRTFYPTEIDHGAFGQISFTFYDVFLYPTFEIVISAHFQLLIAYGQTEILILDIIGLFEIMPMGFALYVKV